MNTNYTSVEPNWQVKPYGTKFEPFNGRIKAFGGHLSFMKLSDSKLHVKLDSEFKKTEKKVLKPEDAPKVLPWVHIAISNAKSMFLNLYHGIKDEYLQSYLDEFCYKFNRMYFGEHLFDRLMSASITYTPVFKHRIYNENISPSCG